MELKIRINGVDHKAEAQLLKGTLWVHHEGRTFTVDTLSGQKSRRKGGAGGSSDTVAAPMPGKVTKILVQPGMLVKKGQAILVMEAMKMEYTLKSEIDGSVEAIASEVGDQVVLGKSLVKLKASADK